MEIVPIIYLVYVILSHFIISAFSNVLFGTQAVKNTFFNIHKHDLNHDVNLNRNYECFVCDMFLLKHFFYIHKLNLSALRGVVHQYNEHT